jgi:hypothetical protein
MYVAKDGVMQRESNMNSSFRPLTISPLLFFHRPQPACRDRRRRQHFRQGPEPPEPERDAAGAGRDVRQGAGGCAANRLACGAVARDSRRP